MTSRYRLALASIAALTLACGDDIPGEGSTTDASTGDDATTGSPTSTPPPTTNDPSTTSDDPSTSGTPTSGDPTTGDPDSTSGDPTTGDATTGDTGETTGPALGCQLVFTELMHRPVGDGDSWEWVEVVNVGDTACDMAGWVFDDGNATLHESANIASGTVEPDTAAVLFHGVGPLSITEEDFRTAWDDGGAAINLIAVENMDASGLGGGGDEIALWPSFADYDGDVGTWANVHVMFTYDTADGFPDTADGSSAYLTDVALDHEDDTNWAETLDTTDDVVTSVAIPAIGYPGGALATPGVVPGL